MQLLGLLRRGSGVRLRRVQGRRRLRRALLRLGRRGFGCLLRCPELAAQFIGLAARGLDRRGRLLRRVARALARGLERRGRRRELLLGGVDFALELCLCRLGLGGRSGDRGLGLGARGLDGLGLRVCVLAGGG